MFTKRLMWVLWPSFLVAGLMEMLVFATVDPEDLHWAGQPLDLSRQGIYTLAFFVFWGLIMLASALTVLLSLSPQEVNHLPDDDDDSAQGRSAKA